MAIRPAGAPGGDHEKMPTAQAVGMYGVLVALFYGQCLLGLIPTAAGQSIRRNCSKAWLFSTLGKTLKNVH